MAEYLVEYEKNQYASCYENNYPGQEVTLELVLQDYGVTTLEELCEDWGYETVEDLIIGGRYIGRTEYQQYYAYFELQYARNITITNPDGTTRTITNLSRGSTYAVFENGVYTFSADFDGQIKSISVEINSIKNEELELAKDGESYLIYTIEDLVRFSTNVNRGFDYEGKTVKLMNSLDFFQDNSYENPEDTSFGDYNGDGAVEGIKEELIKITGSGFIPIAGKDLWIKETYQTIQHTFKGVFEGNSYEINNMYINNNSLYYQGLFGKNYGTIQNLDISGDIVVEAPNNWSSYYIGSIAGGNYGTILNCDNSIEFDVNAKYIYIGGITGRNETALILDCRNFSDITVTKGTNLAEVGGITALMNNYNSKIVRCVNEGEIYISDKNSSYAGGICSDYGQSGKIISCVNTKNITVNNSVNSYVGGILGDQRAGFILNTYNRGDINVVVAPNSSGETFVGGITGAGNIPKMSTVLNTGDITVSGDTAANVGGIIGFKYWDVISNVYNIGLITGNDKAICGGIAGVGHGDITGGYAEGTASTGIGNYPSRIPNSMDLSIDILLEIMNSAYEDIPEGYKADYIEEDFSKWKIDESFSSEYPIFEWE